MSPKTIVKILTVLTVSCGLLATAAIVTMIGSGADWMELATGSLAVICAYICIVQLLFVKQAYRGYKDPDEK